MLLHVLLIPLRINSMKIIRYILLFLFCLPLSGYSQLYITTNATDTLLYSKKRMTVDFTYKRTGAGASSLFNDLKNSDGVIVMQITARTKNSVSGKLHLNEHVNPTIFRSFLRLHKMSFCYVNNIQIQSDMFLTEQELRNETLFAYPTHNDNTKSICEQLNNLFVLEYNYKKGDYAKHLYNGSVSANKEHIIQLRKELIALENLKK